MGIDRCVMIYFMTRCLLSFRAQLAALVLCFSLIFSLAGQIEECLK